MTNARLFVVVGGGGAWHERMCLIAVLYEQLSE